MNAEVRTKLEQESFNPALTGLGQRHSAPRLADRAHEVVRWAKLRWGPQPGNGGRPVQGLESSGLDLRFLSGVLTLVIMLGEAQAAIRRPTSAAARLVLERDATVLQGAFGAALDFLAMSDPELKRALRTLRRANARMGESFAEVAARLESVKLLATKHAEALIALPRFEADWLPRADALIIALRDWSAVLDRDRQLMLRRDRLRALLVHKLETIRVGARFVFHDQPELLEDLPTLGRGRRRELDELDELPEEAFDEDSEVPEADPSAEEAPLEPPSAEAAPS